MDLGVVHVVAAILALALGAVVLLRGKGGAQHVALGRLYVGAVLAVGLPALLLYEIDGRPNAFHVLAVVSLVTTGLGWIAARGLRRSGGGQQRVVAHAAFMTWSWIGVVTAGVAQLAHARWPEPSPWPVLAVVAVSTVGGLVAVPRYVARQARRRGLPAPR